MFVPFGDWAPDQAALDSPGSPSAINVSPGDRPGTYRSFPKLVEFTSALPSRVLGAHGVRALGGTPYMYAATAAGIRILTGVAWTDKSKVGGYNLTGVEQWGAVQWRDKIIFASLTDPIQTDDIGGTGFADMITSTRKPKARHVEVVNRDWVVLGNCTDAVDGERPGRVWWLARGDPTDADPDTVTQCGFEDMDGADGAVQKIIGGEYGTIVLKKGIWRMTYQGGDVGYRFDRIVRGRGAISAGAVVDFDRTTFFIDEDGFYKFDGVNMTPIGEARWNKTFWRELDSENMDWITGAVDHKRSLIAFAYPRAGTVPDRAFLYNWKTDRAAIVDIVVERLFTGLTPSIFTDDAAVADLVTDDYPQSEWDVDSSEFVGQLQAFAAFKTDHKMWTFTGAAMEATITTAEKPVAGGRGRSQVTGVRPMIDGDVTATVAVGTRESQSSRAVTWGPETAVNLAGIAPVLHQGRYVRARVKTSGDFDHAFGVTVDAQPVGEF